MIYQANHQLRLDRAVEHLKSLKAEVAEWQEEHPVRIVPDFDLQSGKKLVRVKDVQAPPPRFSVIIGDCLHNLRSALDNLAYQLAETGYGGPIPDSIAKSVEFPIFLTRGDWNYRKAGAKRITHMRAGAKAIIKGLQPYNRGDETAASHDLLWILHKLNNIDKHRLPHLTQSVPRNITFYATHSVGLSGVEIIWGAIQEDAVIARYDPPGDTYAEVDMQRPPTFSIAFKQGPQLPIEAWPVEVILQRTLNYINQKVIRPLLPFHS
jgi:hypothetical protein